MGANIGSMKPEDMYDVREGAAPTNPWYRRVDVIHYINRTSTIDQTPKPHYRE